MATEYNLIPIHQYDKLMKLQTKMDNEANNSKKLLPNLRKSNNGEDVQNKEIKSKELSTVAGVKETREEAEEIKMVDNDNSLDINDSDIEHGKDTSNITSVKKQPLNNSKLKKKLVNIKATRYGTVHDHAIEAIAEQFNQPLKRKVKRLIVYMFKFGRDIELKDGVLFYKNDVLGDVVKLVKSLFGVNPPMKGLRKLRRVLFILSVPSELYTMSTKERTVMAAESKTVEGDSSKIDWLRY